MAAVIVSSINYVFHVLSYLLDPVQPLDRFFLVPVFGQDSVGILGKRISAGSIDAVEVDGHQYACVCVILRASPFS